MVGIAVSGLASRRPYDFGRCILARHSISSDKVCTWLNIQPTRIQQDTQDALVKSMVVKCRIRWHDALQLQRTTIPREENLIVQCRLTRESKSVSCKTRFTDVTLTFGIESFPNVWMCPLNDVCVLTLYKQMFHLHQVFLQWLQT